MKKAITLIFTVLVLVSCGHSKDSNKAEKKQNITVGGDKTKEGCKKSAGYTWSVLKQDCIRVFEDGLRLNPIEAKEKGEAVYSAFVVYNDDKSKLELFILNEDKSVILPKTEDGKYSTEKYTFNASTNTLSINDKEAYKAD